VSTRTAIAAFVPRLRTVAPGTIESGAPFERPCVRTDTVFGDGSGTRVLRFMGRSAVPGIVAGRRLVAEGTPSLGRDVLILGNPLYSFGTPE
jgi:hypothetical protein